MASIDSPYLGVGVELTDERRDHIERAHPPLLPVFEKLLTETVADPDFVGDRVGRPEIGIAVSARAPRREVHSRRSCLRRAAARSGRAILGRDRVHRTIYPNVETDLESQLTFSYDREGDVLYVDALQPYGGQESDEIGDGVVARMNPESGEVENLELLFFSSRFGELGQKLHLPLGARFTPPLAG